jgi:ATP-dependent helicase/nuclease subunit B
MAAAVTFVVGRAGAGKSRYLREYAASLAAAGERAYYIVPEQFTFETERALCRSLGGLLDIRVCSFTTLADRVLKETGERRVFLTRQGRRMVIRKCAEDSAKRLNAFARVYDRPGFSEKCDEFFTLCKRFDIFPENLAEAADKMAAGSPLREKLTDLARIYGAYQAHLSAQSLDAEDAFFVLCERLPDSSVKGAQIVIDGFDLISEQLFDIISVLMDVSPRITVAMRLDLSPRCRDARVFAAEERVYARIRNLAAQKGCSVETVRLPGETSTDDPARAKAPALVHLEREGFAYPYCACDGAASDAIRVFAGTDVRAEAEAAADAILQAAASGMRFRDMALIAADMEKYLEPVGRALRARDIPFFTDAKHPLSGYPAAVLCVSALRAASRGFPAEEVLRLAKTGLADAARGETEALENYILEKNARGSMLQKPFPPGAPEEAEAARAKLMEPLSRLRAGLSASRTAAGKAAALYEYMLSLSLRDKLVSLTEELRLDGELERMEETAQVYNMLLELIGQMHAILGETNVSTARFVDIFEEGVSSYEVGVIPSNADQLLFGSLGRSRARDLEALYILGASQGAFPAAVTDDGMISDAEIATLAGLGLTELPDTGKRADKELADVYGAVTRPRTLLYLSYPLAGTDGAPCALIDRIGELFPDVTARTDLAPGPPVSPESALRRLSAALRAGVDAGEMSAYAAPLYAAFAARGGSEGWGARLNNIERALFYNASPEPFGQELAAALYGAPLRGSASRLEAFNACPFKHFARYGLKLEPRREYRERSADEGTFCHDALSLFTKTLIERDQAPGLYTEEEIESILAEILPKLAAEHNGGILLDTARNRALFARLARKIAATAKAVVAQLAAGSFRLSGCEVPFGRGKPFPPIVLELPGGRTYELSGRIDRVDAYAAPDGETYVRVVDYKTGNASLAMEDLYEGLKLQLPLYIRAITCVARVEEKAARAAGMYYLPVAEPVVPEGDEAQVLDALLRAFRMKGLTVADAALMEAGGAGVAFSGRRTKYAVGADSFDAASRYAAEKAAATARSIAEGRAETAPFRRKNGFTACGMCDFATVCGFDASLSGCAYRSVRGMTVDAFFREVTDAKVDG